MLNIFKCVFLLKWRSFLLNGIVFAVSLFLLGTTNSLASKEEEETLRVSPWVETVCAINEKEPDLLTDVIFEFSSPADLGRISSTISVLQERNKPSPVTKKETPRFSGVQKIVHFLRGGQKSQSETVKTPTFREDAQEALDVFHKAIEQNFSHRLERILNLLVSVGEAEDIEKARNTIINRLNYYDYHCSKILLRKLGNKIKYIRWRLSGNKTSGEKRRLLEQYQEMIEEEFPGKWQEVLNALKEERSDADLYRDLYQEIVMPYTFRFYHQKQDAYLCLLFAPYKADILKRPIPCYSETAQGMEAILSYLRFIPIECFRVRNPVFTEENWKSLVDFWNRKSVAQFECTFSLDWKKKFVPEVLSCDFSSSCSLGCIAFFEDEERLEEEMEEYEWHDCNRNYSGPEVCLRGLPKTLKRLIVRPGDENLLSLVDSIKRSKLQLDYLKVKGVSDKGVYILASIVPYVQDLNISVCSFSEKGLKVLGNALSVARKYSSKHRALHPFSALLQFGMAEEEADEAMGNLQTLYPGCWAGEVRENLDE